MAHLGRYKVKGKKGTICRSGVETDTAEVTVLKHAVVVEAVDEATNAKGDVRLRLQRPVRGWVSLKTLVRVEAEAAPRVVAKRTPGSAAAKGDWPMVNVSTEAIEMCQKWLNLFKSLDEARFQAKPLPRWFLPSPPATQRSYFDSMGALDPPANPSGYKAPSVAPRCADALPPTTGGVEVLPSTAERYRLASLTCGPGVPACFPRGGMIEDDDAVYASLWRPPADGGRGLPAAWKHCYDPFSGAMLPISTSFLNGGGDASDRGVDLRLFYDDEAEAVRGALQGRKRVRKSQLQRLLSRSVSTRFG